MAEFKLTKAAINWLNLSNDIKTWGAELGFQKIGITDVNLAQAEAHLMQWLANGYHGTMDYLAKHGTRRSRPQELVPGTVRVIVALMAYLPQLNVAPQQILANPDLGYISRYALGRDYHKVLVARLKQLTRRIINEIGDFNYRIFVDSAPVLEKPLAEKAGLGWIGKNTNLISRDNGSWNFIGEIYTELPLIIDRPAASHCGNCTKCIDSCPTKALIAPYILDARRCIAYLTIELRDAIPENLRPLLGNRIYGCDDCQLVCPWNRFALPTKEADFFPRHGLEAPRLLSLIGWSKDNFLRYTEGSALRRITYEQFLRNVLIAVDNGVNRKNGLLSKMN